MKKNLFYVMSLAAVFSLGSCSQEDLADVQKEDGVKLGIKSISATAVQSRGTGIIEGEYLPSGSKVGLWINEDGMFYNDVMYENIVCTATGTGSSQTWNVGRDILLYGEGDVFLYYPYNADHYDYSEIPIDCTTNNDYMYATGIASASEPELEANLQHICAWIQINVQKGNYSGACELDEIGMGNVGVTGTFNLRTGVYTDNNSSVYIQENLGNFASGLTVNYLVVPISNKTPWMFTYVDNLETVQHNFSEKWQAGKKYIYNLTINEDKYLNISLLGVNDWETVGTYDIETKPM